MRRSSLLKTMQLYSYNMIILLIIKEDFTLKLVRTLGCNVKYSIRSHSSLASGLGPLGTPESTSTDPAGDQTGIRSADSSTIQDLSSQICWDHDTSTNVQYQYKPSMTRWRRSSCCLENQRSDVPRLPVRSVRTFPKLLLSSDPSS